MPVFQNASFEPLNRSLAEAASEALTTAFEEVGLQFSSFHPTIRAVMNRAALSSAHAKQQVERFVRVAAMADQYDLSDEQKQYALMKAYEQHAERLAKSEEVGGNGQDEATSQSSPTDPSEPPVPMAL
jgi:hypothetical protein